MNRAFIMKTPSMFLFFIVHCLAFGLQSKTKSEWKTKLNLTLQDSDRTSEAAGRGRSGGWNRRPPSYWDRHQRHLCESSALQQRSVWLSPFLTGFDFIFSLFGESFSDATSTNEMLHVRAYCLKVILMIMLIDSAYVNNTNGNTNNNTNTPLCLPALNERVIQLLKAARPRLSKWTNHSFVLGVGGVFAYIWFCVPRGWPIQWLKWMKTKQSLVSDSYKLVSDKNNCVSVEWRPLTSAVTNSDLMW